MDSITDLSDLLSKPEDVLQAATKHQPIKNKNDCEERRDEIGVNKKMLKNTMHKYTTIVENEIEKDSEIRKDIEVTNAGDKSWKSQLSSQGNDGGLRGDIYRLMHPEISSEVKTNSEVRYTDDIARLKSERSNRMYHEQMMAKNRMGRKIKSKNFHRHAKRRELKEFMKNEELQKSQNPDAFQEKLAEFERIRADERISLKHKVGGKFAKIQKLRAKYDPNAREALNAMHDKSHELRTRVNDDSDEDDDDEVGKVAEDDDEEIVEELSVASDEEMVAGNAGEFTNSKHHKAKTFVEANNTTASRPTGKVSAVLSTSQSAFINYDDNDMEAGASQTVSGEERFKQAIYDVYQVDPELLVEFEREKQELIEREKPKDIQLFKPGWGSWTGAGFEESDKKRLKEGIIKAPTGKRRDQKKPRVWIKQGMHDGLKKHLVKSIPYPYNTVEQYNLSRKELVSAAFNMQTVHRQIIKPKFVNKAGKPIYPLQKSS